MQSVLLVILAVITVDAPVSVAGYRLLLLTWQVIRTFLSVGSLIYYLLIIPSRSHKGKFLPHTSF